MDDGDTDLRTRRNNVAFNKFGVSLPISEYTVLVIDITDVGLLHIRNVWHIIQRGY